MEARSRMRIATILDVRKYKCILQRKCTDHGVMCVITRYTETWRRLKVHW